MQMLISQQAEQIGNWYYVAYNGDENIVDAYAEENVFGCTFVKNSITKTATLTDDCKIVVTKHSGDISTCHIPVKYKNRKFHDLLVEHANDIRERIKDGSYSPKNAHRGGIKPVVRSMPKVGRNDPCNCGKLDANGKPIKYKKCCGK